VNLAQHFLAGLAGAALASAVGVTVLWLDRQRWISRARGLAEWSDIALPGPLAGRVARFLRGQFLVGQPWLVVALPLAWTAVFSGGQPGTWAAWFPWFLAGVPLSCAIFGFARGLWPRWQAPGGYRVTHLGSVPVRQAFTRAEGIALVTGVACSAAAGAGGLWYIRAPATWWLACAAAMAAALATWRHAAASVMKRPSSASNAIELAWDDLLRFRQVRDMTACAAWGPALLVYLADCIMSSAFFHTTPAPGMVRADLIGWSLLVPVVILVVLAVVFRQGRHLWRQAWMERDGGG
jgi:hypothetical protein